MSISDSKDDLNCLNCF